MRQRPKLIVMITVDQGMYDYPRPRPVGYGAPQKGADERFLTEGMVYQEAFYAHSGSVTEPGHMTLVAGGNPDTDGIPRNQWLDRKTGKFANDIYDPRYRIVGNTERTCDQELLSQCPGTAPTALLDNAGTLGDRLIQSDGGKAKVFAIGMGDWPTIPMAGGEGLALWYDYTSGEFVSSDYFYSDLPQWVKEWNKTDPVKHFLDKHLPKDKDGSWVWELLHDEKFYRNSDRNEANSRFVRPPCYPSQTNWEYSPGRTFDHKLPVPSLNPSSIVPLNNSRRPVGHSA